MGVSPYSSKKAAFLIKDFERYSRLFNVKDQCERWTNFNCISTDWNIQRNKNSRLLKSVSFYWDSSSESTAKKNEEIWKQHRRTDEVAISQKNHFSPLHLSAFPTKRDVLFSRLKSWIFLRIGWSFFLSPYKIRRHKCRQMLPGLFRLLAGERRTACSSGRGNSATM